MILRAATLVSMLLTGTALAEMTVLSQTWVCERGVAVPVVRVSDPQGAIVVMNVDGRQITLHGDAGAESDRFSWPSGGSGYVWTEDAGVGRVLWHDGTNGTEVSILTGCKPAE